MADLPDGWQFLTQDPYLAQHVSGAQAAGDTLEAVLDGIAQIEDKKARTAPEHTDHTPDVEEEAV